MEKSSVYVSMRNENKINCSYAVVEKIANDKSYKAIIIVKDTELAIFDYSIFSNADEFLFHYLCLKHHLSDLSAYNDFLRLIGKMCKKSAASKYFANHIVEDNRMLVDVENQIMFDKYEESRDEYDKRLNDFKYFIINCYKNKLFLFGEQDNDIT